MPPERIAAGSFARPLVALSLTGADVGLLKYASMVGPLVGAQEIRFAHVLGVRSSGGGDNSAIRTRMESEVRACCDELPEGVAFDVESGPRLDVLLELSLRHRNDLILVGHGRTHSGRRSLARRLAMVAPCSVWLAPEASPCRVTSILAPIDFSSHSADALSVAASLAAVRGIERIQALHVFFDSSTIRYDEHIEEIRGQEEEAFQRMLRDVDRHGVQVDPIFEESTHVSEAILRTAKRLESDLIVMNTRGRSRAAAVFLGSVTSATMAATETPLLAVKHFGSRVPLLSAILSQMFWGEPTPKTN